MYCKWHNTNHKIVHEYKGGILMSKLFKLSAIWCGIYYPLTIRRETLEQAIETIKIILPGCTNIKEWRD